VQFSAYDAATNTTRIFVGTDTTAGADLTVVLQGQYDPANFSRGVVFTGTQLSDLTYTPPPPPPPPTDPAQTFNGTSVADTFTSGTGNDTLKGGGGNDTLDGSGGDDQMDGQAGNDRLFGGDGQDSIFGSAGSDHIEGGNGHDVLVGGIGNDQLWGDEGADWIQGDDGNDRLTGGGGDDFLIGGIGADTLVGNAGADTFFFDNGSGLDQIQFFFVSHHDRIRIVSDVNGSGILTAQDAYAHTTDTANGAVVDLGAGNSILLVGVHPDAITAGVFEIV
jgi:Ca2+-binding RTX toxin-like protein